MFQSIFIELFTLRSRSSGAVGGFQPVEGGFEEFFPERGAISCSREEVEDRRDEAQCEDHLRRSQADRQHTLNTKIL